MASLLVSAALVFAFDYWTKSVAAEVARVPIALGPFLRLRYAASRKPLMRTTHARCLLLAVWLFALLSALALSALDNGAHPALPIGMGIAVGGATGNLLDLMRTGAVADFIDPRFWPAFNIADVAILGGLALAFWPA
jgi:signal peptidase II